MSEGPATSPAVRVSWRIRIGVATVLTLLFAFQNYSAPTIQRGSPSFGRTVALQIIVWSTWLVLSPLVFAAARRWRRDPRVTVDTVAEQVLISLGVATLHPLVAGTIRWSAGLSVSEELGTVLLASMFANSGANVLRYWAIAAAYHAVAYHREVRDRDVRAVRLEASLVQAKLDSLQGRLHPHFLFNTLNSIAALIREDPAGAEQMLGSLSELLRASLQADPSREVTLERELDLIRQYVSIQQRRFQDRLSVSIEATPDVLHAYVPHLVLQPLVENAIRHGIAPREAPGHVRIAAGRSGEQLRLVVEDDGVGSACGPREESESSSAAARASGGGAPRAVRDAAGVSGSPGFGLTSTRARLQHLYGTAATFDLKQRTPTGVEAIVELPYHLAPVATPAVQGNRAL